ncbi:hypothetical protein Skr01_76090 [Sphaerisporangium krabiense]|uniref:Transposase IS701-like DDE domain-containing protein n=1 Tax=Sphaerisporangium krabiense TaxID=763782 RepID=A0A7W9DTF4_9ACTN|nr:hypothetical protein [Sphaerisporangium krabiense]MBB5629341.1 hypothetical protein [Sphaerisporangium krabiense]GII67524.1 hypothetical protein Skr01_76090 [Sphaerisporangium krabiense]
MAASRSVDPDGWTVIFNELMARIAGRFGRVEPRRAAGVYVRGLLADIDRENCWNLAEHAAANGPQTLQRLLRTARWDADAVRDDVRAFVVGQLGPDGVLVVDETGFVKKGTLGRCATPIRRHRRPDRELPDRRVAGLRHPSRAGVAGSAALPARAHLAGRLRPVSRGRGPR